MTIAYLINQYPKVSHSFIRREIAGIEAFGLEVARFSIRSCKAELVDAEDKQEFDKTRVVLHVGVLGLCLSMAMIAFTRPIRWLKTLNLAFQLGLSSDRGIIYHVIYLAEACVLLRWFIPEEISHVHSHFGTNSTTVAMLCNSLGGPPYSFTVHGPEEFDCPTSLSLTQKISRSKFVVAVSSFGRSQLYRWCDHQQWYKIYVVRCGVDEKFFNSSQPIPENPDLVCVGRLCEQKGQLLLVHAVSQLASEGVPFSLTLVGDGPDRPQLEALIQHYELEKQIKITGWASGDQVRAYILNSRILVLPSFAEGLPVVIMEALALGRPVISTYIAGIPELVRNEINGWLVPAGSLEDLTEALRTGLQLAPAHLERMGQAGIECVKQRHDSFMESKKLVQLFSSTMPLRPSLFSLHAHELTCSTKR
jgi:glycosyltransferase involved in cell wall biosynthesis